MNRRLPSLLAVRYFESVGRNLSFTLAANELNVTQAAVSHQIRLLEEELGVKFFTRLHQRIELTPEGLQLLDVATECLDRLADTFDLVSGRDRSERIHLSTTPLLSARWLMPQLGDYLNNAKNTEIILHHSLEPPNDREPKFDLKIFFSTEPLEDAGYDFLFSDRLVPVCSPSLLKEGSSESRTELLSRVGLVHEFNYDWWGEWCRRSGLDPALTQRGIVLDDPAVLENAALLGHGIILGSTLFLKDKLEKGDLVLPFGADPSFAIFYYLLTKPARASRRSVSNFRRWLLQRSMQSRRPDDTQLQMLNRKN